MASTDAPAPSDEEKLKADFERRKMELRTEERMQRNENATLMAQLEKVRAHVNARQLQEARGAARGTRSGIGPVGVAHRTESHTRTRAPPAPAATARTSRSRTAGSWLMQCLSARRNRALQKINLTPPKSASHFLCYSNPFSRFPEASRSPKK